MNIKPFSADQQAAIKRLKDFVGAQQPEGVPPFCFYDEIPDRAKALTGGTNLGELLQRAQEGDAVALAKYAFYLSIHCHELELLRQQKPDFVKSVACCFTDWPVNASPFRVHNKHELPELLERLDVGGDDAELPARSNQRRYRENLWTKYALNIVWYLRTARPLVAKRLEECKKAGAEFLSPVRILRTTHRATWYVVDGKRVLLPEWQKQCVNLPTRLTKKNVKAFMDVAGIALREFWCVHPEHFEQVKQKIGRQAKSNTLGQNIDSALQKIGQALESIAHKA
jgi:hypothetical protein